MESFDLVAGQSWIYPSNYPLREYQKKIVETSLFQNTMVCLPTGLGKTLVAAVVMLNYHLWFPKGVIVFMAPTRPLVSQQIEACHGIVGIAENETAHLYGAIDSDKRLSIWRNRTVIFCTPQILENDLRDGLIEARRIVCLVFDEAHKATGNYAYTKIIKHMEGVGAVYRVLALTATPGNDARAVQQVVHYLRISAIECRTEDDEDVAPYTNAKQIEIVHCKAKGGVSDIGLIKNHINALLQPVVRQLCQYNIFCSDDVESITSFVLREAEGNLDRCRSMDSHTVHLLSAMLQLVGIFISWKSKVVAVSSGTKGVHAMKAPLVGLLEYMSSLRTSACTASGSRSDLIDIQKITQAKSFTSLYSILEHRLHSGMGSEPPSQKQEKLQAILEEHFRRFCAVRGEGSTRAIVFVATRAVVHEIVARLSGCSELLPVAFVGQASKSSSSSLYGERGLNQAEQEHILDSFRTGKCNVLVATCIAEEGLDIGEVDLIVCYDSVSSPLRLMQRMGRTGRKRAGRVVLLVVEGKDTSRVDKSGIAANSVVSILKNASSKLRLNRSSPRMIPNDVHPFFQLRDLARREGFDRSKVAGLKPKAVSSSYSDQAGTSAPNTYRSLLTAAGLCEGSSAPISVSNGPDTCSTGEKYTSNQVNDFWKPAASIDRGDLVGSTSPSDLLTAHPSSASGRGAVGKFKVDADMTSQRMTIQTAVWKCLICQSDTVEESKLCTDCIAAALDGADEGHGCAELQDGGIASGNEAEPTATNPLLPTTAGPCSIQRPADPYLLEYINMKTRLREVALAFQKQQAMEKYQQLYYQFPCANDIDSSRAINVFLKPSGPVEFNDRISVVDICRSSLLSGHNTMGLPNAIGSSPLSVVEAVRSPDVATDVSPHVSRSVKACSGIKRNMELALRYKMISEGLGSNYHCPQKLDLSARQVSVVHASHERKSSPINNHCLLETAASNVPASRPSFILPSLSSSSSDSDSDDEVSGIVPEDSERISSVSIGIADGDYCQNCFSPHAAVVEKTEEQIIGCLKKKRPINKAQSSITISAPLRGWAHQGDEKTNRNLMSVVVGKGFKRPVQRGDAGAALILGERCGICTTDEVSSLNPIIKCSGPCGCCLHIACYGLQAVPRSDWLCDSCCFLASSGSASLAPLCSLCQHPNGLVRPTHSAHSEDMWVHPICALFTPELTCDKISMRADNMVLLDKDRKDLCCSVCRRFGGCIQCSYSFCRVAVHPYCAFRSSKLLIVRHSRKLRSISRPVEVGSGSDVDSVNNCSQLSSQSSDSDMENNGFIYEYYCDIHTNRVSNDKDDVISSTISNLRYCANKARTASRDQQGARERSLLGTPNNPSRKDAAPDTEDSAAILVDTPEHEDQLKKSEMAMKRSRIHKLSDRSGKTSLPPREPNRKHNGARMKVKKNSDIQKHIKLLIHDEASCSEVDSSCDSDASDDVLSGNFINDGDYTQASPINTGLSMYHSLHRKFVDESPCLSNIKKLLGARGKRRKSKGIAMPVLESVLTNKRESKKRSREGSGNGFLLPNSSCSSSSEAYVDSDGICRSLESDCERNRRKTSKVDNFFPCGNSKYLGQQFMIPSSSSSYGSSNS